MTPLKVPVTFVLNYQTMERKTFPAGTLICRFEWRKLTTVGGSSYSEGQSIAYRNGRLQRDDGKDVI